MTSDDTYSYYSEHTQSGAFYRPVAAKQNIRQNGTNDDTTGNACGTQSDTTTVQMSTVTTVPLQRYISKLLRYFCGADTEQFYEC